MFPCESVVTNYAVQIPTSRKTRRAKTQMMKSWHFETSRCLLNLERKWQYVAELGGMSERRHDIKCSQLTSPSGKSSIVLLLLRLLDPLPSHDHSITIDGIPLYQIDRNTLRSRIIALPQDTFFLPDGSTYLANVDPQSLSSPAECESALDEVGLWNLIKQRGGLDQKMTADSLSQGQKQLFSLARAVLRARIRASRNPLKSEKGVGKRSGVLLLDEVSSSVDGATDALIQRVIRKEFDGYTIVAVAHRVDSVKDFDKMVVMETGSIKEVGEPLRVQAVL